MNWSQSNAAKVWKLVATRGLRAGISDAVARWARIRTSVPRDVLGAYPWILEPNRPAILPPPQAGSLKINWLLSDLGKAGGGLSNIFRTIHHLEKWGHQNRVFILDRNSIAGAEAQKLVRAFYFPVEAPIELLNENIVDSDALVATNWISAYAARAVANTAKKFYFAQDLEDRFYAEGSLSEFARETYRWGFYGITLGEWIADILRTEFGMECSSFGFSYDREVYSPNGNPLVRRKKRRVLFYARPLTERRGFELGMMALSLVAKKRPDVEFVLVGFPPWKMRIAFRAVFPGVLPPAELAGLYRDCDIALVLSHTNLSMLPLELMACGCAVVSNRGPNVERILTEETTELAALTPQSLSEAILRLLDDEQLRARKIAAGLAFVQRTDWKSEITKIEDAFYHALAARADGARVPAMTEER